MDIVTVFGSIWRVEPMTNVLTFLAVFLGVLFAIIAGFKYLEMQKSKHAHDYQLFLFRMKKMGLTSFQIKLINNMAANLQLDNPVVLLTDQSRFEKALAGFLAFLRSKKEGRETLVSICRELTITFDRLYSETGYLPPLEKISELEINQMVYFFIPSGDVYLGLLTERNDTFFTLRLFRPKGELAQLVPDTPLNVFFWRVGDAEYSFDARVTGLENQTLRISMPESFKREREARHPYLEIMLNAELVLVPPRPVIEPVYYKATIFRINDYEAVLRVPAQLNFQSQYRLEFELAGYKFSINCRLVAGRTVTEGELNYYTLKYIDMSEASKKVLLAYVHDHL